MSLSDYHVASLQIRASQLHMLPGERPPLLNCIEITEVQLAQPVHVWVTPDTRDEIARRLSLSADQLRQSLTSALAYKDELPCQGDSQIIDHLVAEVEEDATLSVKVLCFPPEVASRPTDGEIFRNVRHYMALNLEDVAHEWMAHLSAPKFRHMQLLLNRKDILNHMDQLLDIPGLWGGLELGNWAKHLAVHCDTMIQNFWAHINQVWRHDILSGVGSLHLVDTESVKLLQFLAPASFQDDEFKVRTLFRNGILFPAMDDATRTVLKHNILRVSAIIPSIKTFHTNMKYHGTGMTILKTLVPEYKKRRHSLRPGIVQRPDLLKALRRIWSPTKALEVKHLQFTNSFANTFDLALMQLLLGALRIFPSLSMESPLMGKPGKRFTEFLDRQTCLHVLCRVAINVGFSNPFIRQHNKSCLQTSFAGLDPGRDAEKRWRGGIPTFDAFVQHRSHSYLLDLYACSSRSSASLWVQRDMLQAFFQLTFDHTGTTDQSKEIVGQRTASKDTASRPRSIASLSVATELMARGEDEDGNKDENEDGDEDHDSANEGDDDSGDALYVGDEDDDASSVGIPSIKSAQVEPLPSPRSLRSRVPSSTSHSRQLVPPPSQAQADPGTRDNSASQIAEESDLNIGVVRSPTTSLCTVPVTPLDPQWARTRIEMAEEGDSMNCDDSVSGEGRGSRSPQIPSTFEEFGTVAPLSLSP